MKTINNDYHSKLMTSNSNATYKIPSMGEDDEVIFGTSDSRTSGENHGMITY